MKWTTFLHGTPCTKKGGVVGGGKTIWHRSTYISKKKSHNKERF